MTSAKDKLLDASMRVFIAKGYTATRVEDVCEAAGVTKGSFFHHFPTKEALAVEAAAYFAAMADRLFANAKYQEKQTPADRILGYIDYRIALMTGDPTEYTCLLGTLVQETYDTYPAIREAAGAHLIAHAEMLAKDVVAAGLAASLATFIQSSVQGAFILAKAQRSSHVAVECLRHLRNYVTKELDHVR